jgi:hypothetical protein
MNIRSLPEFAGIIFDTDGSEISDSLMIRQGKAADIPVPSGQHSVV